MGVVFIMEGRYNFFHATPQRIAVLKLCTFLVFNIFHLNKIFLLKKKQFRHYRLDIGDLRVKKYRQKLRRNLEKQMTNPRYSGYRNYYYDFRNICWNKALLLVFQRIIPPQWFLVNFFHLVVTLFPSTIHKQRAV